MRLAVDLRCRCALPAAFRMQQGAALRRCWYAGRTADVVAAFGHGVASAVLVGINTVNGSSSDDVLTVSQPSFTTTFDMGAGNDTVNFAGQAFGATVVNAETVNGSAGSDFITIGNTTGTTTVTGGLGADTLVASAAADNFRFTSAAESQTGNGDTVVNFNAASDTSTFAGMTGGPSGFSGPVHFVGTAAFDGSLGAPHSEARVDVAGGTANLQIDVNGDGLMDSHDIEIHLTNYVGT